MKKLILTLFGIIFLASSIAGCAGQAAVSQSEETILSADFEDIKSEAKGTTVTFYGWGGSDKINSWIDGYLADTLKKDYDITLKRVGMNIEDILNGLINEKQMDVQDGNIDVVWINGENFYTASENELLFGPFAEKLPNFESYIDKESDDVKYDFGYPTNGYEVPYGKAQLVMIYDEAMIKTPPKNYAELLQLAKENPGKITYPAPPDFTGSAFVRNIIFDVLGKTDLRDVKTDKAEIKKAIQPAIDYMKELKPYLWQQGKTYPASSALLDNMYADGEIIMSISYEPNHAQAKIEQGEFAASTRSFVFENGTIGNTHFLAIPFNAPNKQGALTVINHILSAEAQASKYSPAVWGDLPSIDHEKLSEEEKEFFSSVDTGEATVPVEILAEKRISEIPADMVPIIEEIWRDEIFSGN